MNAADFAAAASAAVASHSRPACVQLDVAMASIPAGQGLIANNLRPGQPGYRELLTAANGVLAEAFQALRERYGYTDITVAMPLVPAEPGAGPDVTDQLLAEIALITTPLRRVRRAS